MAYGVTKDWFGLGAVSGVEVNASSKSPSYATEATSEDSNGGIVCTTKAGNTVQYQTTYKFCGGGDTLGNFNLDTANLAKIGQVKTFDTVTHIQVTQISLTTSNKDRPVLVVTGIQDTGAAAGTHATFASGIVINKGKKAKHYGITTITGKVIGSTVDISGSLATCEDSQGAIKNREPYGVKISASNQLTNCTTTPTAVADTANGWGLDAPVGFEESNTDYASATVVAFKNVLQS